MKSIISPNWISPDRQRDEAHLRCSKETNPDPNPQAKKCKKPCKKCESQAAEDQAAKQKEEFEPEFDGDLEHQSWVSEHLFDDTSGF